MKAFFLSLLLTASSLTHASNFYSGEEGVVDRADLENGQVVIDDSLYIVGDEFKFHSSRPGMDANRIRKGDKVRYNYIRDNNRNQFLLEAWLLRK